LKNKLNKLAKKNIEGRRNRGGRTGETHGFSKRRDKNEKKKKDRITRAEELLNGASICIVVLKEKIAPGRTGRTRDELR